MQNRILDIFLSLIFLIISVPIFLIIILLNFLNLNFKILFIQNRLGKNFKVFKIIKFKTIDEYGNINFFNKFLRRSSIDELPNLFNVLIGQMSIVGPRPLILDWEDTIRKNFFTRQNVKPGITGLTQISGRNEIDWNDKFLIDVKYVENKNIFLDFLILFKTIFLFFSLYKNNLTIKNKFEYEKK